MATRRTEPGRDPELGRVHRPGTRPVDSSESGRPPWLRCSPGSVQPAEAWQSLEEDLARCLLDELFAREGRRLSRAERGRIRELSGELEKLDKLVEAMPRDLVKSQRAKRFEDLKRQ